MFGISKDRMTVRERMRAGKPGDTLEAAEVGRMLQRECRNSRDQVWHLVEREIRYLERTYSVFWRWDGENRLWHCLHDHEKPKDCERRIVKIRRQSRRNILVAQSADFAKLDSKQQATLGVCLLVSGCIEIMTRGSSIKKLKEHTAEGPFIPTEQTLLNAVRSRYAG